MPLDSRIILGAGVGVQPIDTPLQIEAKRAALGQVRQQAQDAQQARAADAAFRQALQATGGDYDAAIAQSEQQGFNMLPIREAIQKHRKGDLDLAKGMLEQHKTENELMSGLMSEVTDQSSLDTMRPWIARIDPEFAQMLGPTYGPQFEQYKTIGTTAAQQAEWADKALKHYADGDYQKGFGAALMATDNDEGLQGALQFADRQGVPHYITDPYRNRQWTPDIPQKGNALALGAQKATAEKDTSAKVGSFEDYVTRTYGANPTSPQILQARKAYGQADDRPRVSVSVAGSGGSSGELTPEGIDYAATIYRLTNKMPPLGMGRTPARGQIINKAAEQTRLLGQTPVAAIQRQAMFSADSKSLGKLQSMADAAGAYENKALSQLDMVDSLSDKVNRTSIPLLNRAILAGQTEIAGDANATLLLNSILTATTEYAKIMSGGTGSAQAVTDSAQKEAQKLLNASFSKGTLRKATALMRQEMDYTMQGYGAAIKHITERIGGQPQSPGTSAAPTIAAPALRWDPVRKAWIK